MLGLAEFVMRGRWQALAVAILGTGSLFFGWVSAAVVALITLRKGPAEGGWLVLWACLPGVVLAVMTGDSGSVQLLLATFVLALMLRSSESLSLTLLISVPIALLSALALQWLSADFVDDLVDLFAEIVDQMQSSLAAQGGAELALSSLSALQVVAFIAAGNVATAVVSLLLARYWQAAAVWPGQFGREFRSLRLPALWVGLLSLPVLWMVLSDAALASWGVIAAVPLTFCGFALFHARVEARRQGTFAVTMFYLAWVVIDPVKWVVIVAVWADSVLDFRSRWSTPKAPS